MNDVEVLRKLDPTDSWEDNVKCIRSFWNENYGYVIVNYGPDEDGYYEVTLITGGWSENEEVISNLRLSWFWGVFWYQSTRGGKYVLKVKTID